jgi:zinc and cadmium transporter
MDLIGILIATLVAGVGSVWLAALVLRLANRSQLLVGGRYLLSLAAGALLATAFMHLLPEAFESTARPAALFSVLLGGLVVFFLLDKVELWHHGHEHAHEPAASAPAHTHTHGSGHADAHGGHGAADAQGHGTATSHGGAAAHAHAHNHAHSHGHARRGGAWAVLAGDSLHCFGDGIVIASAFAADPALGVVAALSVLAHEVPHHIGDLVVLNAAGRGASRAAVLKLSLAGLVTALGGVAGWWLLERLQDWLPYFLVAASSSFVYVALADLIPQLQIRMTKTQTATQVSWLVVGIAVVTLVSQVVHSGHDHEHGHGRPALASQAPHGEHDGHDHGEHGEHGHGPALPALRALAPPRAASSGSATP